MITSDGRNRGKSKSIVPEQFKVVQGFLLCYKKTREMRTRVRIPYMIVVGEKEEVEGKVSVRSRFLGDEGQKDLGEFIAAIQEEIQNKVNRKVETEE